MKQIQIQFATDGVFLKRSKTETQALPNPSNDSSKIQVNLNKKYCL